MTTPDPTPERTEDAWTKRTAAAYAHYQNYCAIKGQMPLPWDALTQTAKNYWVSKADHENDTLKARAAR